MIYLDLFLTFLKIGAFTFGGGYAMLPLIQEAVISHEWLDAETLINFIAVSESTPGPLAVNMATYIGVEIGGFMGAICATLGVILPSFVIILIVAKCFEKFNKSRIVKGCMTGLKGAVVGLIGAAAISVGKTVFATNTISPAIFCDFTFYASVAIFLSALLMAFKKVHPILIICISAIAGIVLGFFMG